MGYLLVPVPRILQSTRTKITNYSALATENFKIPWAMRFDYLAQVVGQIRDILVRQPIIF